MSLARWGTVIAAAIALEAALFLLAVRAALTVALPELLAEQAVHLLGFVLPPALTWAALILVVGHQSGSSEAGASWRQTTELALSLTVVATPPAFFLAALAWVNLWGT